MTSDIIADQMVAAGVVDKLVFAFVGNSAVGSLHALRRAIEQGEPRWIEVEEYSHYGMVARYLAGAGGLPFYPLRSYAGSDLPGHNINIAKVRSPYPGEDGSPEEIYVVPPIKPDVAIVHAQRADQAGNTQMWGIIGPQQEAAFASRRTIVVVEEIVSEQVVRADPNRTLIPGFQVDAVVECRYGAHPSFVQGYYDRDNDFYRSWSAISKDPDSLQGWLRDWIYDLPDRAAYVAQLGDGHFGPLTPVPAMSAPVNYGCTL
jgi:glutaconate CoA-transferase subunit A